VIFNRTTALELLDELAGRLDDVDVGAHIHIVGGAGVMLSVRPDRDATSNIDSWVNAAGGSAAKVAVKETVIEVARMRPGVPDDWLNEEASGFIPDGVGGAPDEWHELLRRGSVTVSVARPDVLLAMKLRAGRGRRDFPDLPSLIAACGLTTRAEIIDVFDGHFPHDELNSRSLRWLDANYPAG